MTTNIGELKKAKLAKGTRPRLSLNPTGSVGVLSSTETLYAQGEGDHMSSVNVFPGTKQNPANSPEADETGDGATSSSPVFPPWLDEYRLRPDQLAMIRQFVWRGLLSPARAGEDLWAQELSRYRWFARFVKVDACRVHSAYRVFRARLLGLLSMMSYTGRVHQSVDAHGRATAVALQIGSTFGLPSAMHRLADERVTDDTLHSEAVVYCANLPGRDLLFSDSQYKTLLSLLDAK